MTNSSTEFVSDQSTDTLPEGWSETPVQELIEKHFCGPSPDCEERQAVTDEEWAVLKTTAITWRGWNENAHKVLPKSYWGKSALEVQRGDVLVTKAGPRDRVAVVVHVDGDPKRLIVSGKMIGLRPRRSAVVPQFLAGALSLRRPQNYIHARTTGMAESQVNFANTVLLETRVRIPKFGEQSRVAAVLDTVDEAIAKTEAVIAKLWQMRAGLLHDLLTRGLDKNGQLRDPIAHPEQFQDSPLGRIPKEWVVGNVSALAINRDARRVPLKQADRDTRYGIYPYYGASGVIDFVDDYLFDGDFVLIGEDGENLRSRQLPLAFSASGKFWVNNHAHIFEPLPNTDVRFLATILDAQDYVPWLLGSAQPKLTQRNLEFVPLRIPPPPEQTQISDTLDTIDSEIAAATRELTKLCALKSGLMTDLLTGRVRVPESDQ